MTFVLVRKLLRDMRVSLIVVALLLFLFQLLWVRVTERIAGTGQLLDSFKKMGLPVDVIRGKVFEGPGAIIQAIMGGEEIRIEKAQDMVSIAYVHPLTVTILCIWGVGRASGAIAGEIDRGTMELLLAQPIRRSQIVLAHLYVEWLTIPVLALSMWGGTWLGAYLIGFLDPSDPHLRVDPWRFAPALLSVGLLVFAVSGLTMWFSAMGRYRWRVLGRAVVLILLMFLVNVIGQLWTTAKPWRLFTLFNYYQPQPIILLEDWYGQLEVWLRLAVLFAVGASGYCLALWTFCRRDLPAPL